MEPTCDSAMKVWVLLELRSNINVTIRLDGSELSRKDEDHEGGSLENQSSFSVLFLL